MIHLTARDYFRDSASAVTVEPRSPQSDFPEHSHNFEELFIVMSGHGRHILENQATTVTRNMVCRIPPSQPHQFETLDNLFLVNILFRPDHFHNSAQVMNMMSQMKSWHLNDAELTTLQPLIANLNEESHSNRPDSKMMCEALFTQMLIQLWRSAMRAQQTAQVCDQTPANKIIQWINAHYDQSDSLRELASRFGLSERSLTRQFKDLSGSTPSQYLHQVRIEKARKQLREGTDSVTKIGLSVGYKDSNYFSYKFKALTGQTPAEYRRIAKLR